MIRPLPLLLLAAASLPAAEKNGGPSGVSSLLPNGSQLEGVILPRYDEQRRLITALRAETMELVDERTIAGRSVTIDWFDEKDLPRGRFNAAELALTEFDPSNDSGVLKAREVCVDADGMRIKGAALTAPLGKDGNFEGFVSGPATTLAAVPADGATQNDPGKGGKEDDAASSGANPPLAPVTPAAGGMRPAADPKADLASALDASDAANRAARQFLAESGLDSLPVGGTPFSPPTTPHPFEKQDGDMVVSCDGGMYFNRKEGVLVYLGNVRVTHPDFTMKGANELKIFIKEEPRAPQRDSKDTGSPEMAGKASTKMEVERITASGAVLVEQRPGAKPSDKDPIRASGAMLVYDRKRDLLTISGGYPWVVQGGLALRAKQPNLSLRIRPKERSFETQGAWDTIVPVEELGGNKR